MWPEPPNAVPTATLSEPESAFNRAIKSFASLIGESVRTPTAVYSLKSWATHVRSVYASGLLPIIWLLIRLPMMIVR